MAALADAMRQELPDVTDVRAEFTVDDVPYVITAEEDGSSVFVYAVIGASPTSTRMPKTTMHPQAGKTMRWTPATPFCRCDLRPAPSAAYNPPFLPVRGIAFASGREEFGRFGVFIFIFVTDAHLAFLSFNSDSADAPLTFRIVGMLGLTPFATWEGRPPCRPPRRCGVSPRAKQWPDGRLPGCSDERCSDATTARTNIATHNAGTRATRPPTPRSLMGGLKLRWGQTLR